VVLGGTPIPGATAAQPSTAQASTQESTGSRAAGEAGNGLHGTPELSEPTAPPMHTPAPASQPSTVAKGKQKATSPATANHTPPSTSANKAQQAARDALRKKKTKEAEELARIKAKIEADKAERRAQAEAQRAERNQERNIEAHSESHPRTTTSSRGSQAKMVNLSVRLFDGRTIRSTFPRTATLQEDVRAWVDKEFSKLAQDDPNINNKQLPPYYFRHILAPQPSRELSAGDESQTLGDVDLAPSAALVLVPVKGYTEAYAGGGGGITGAASGLVGGAFGLLSSTVGLVGSTLGSVIGYGSAPAQAPTGQTTGSQSSQAAQPPPASEEPSIRVRTLADQRAREPQQFYNGNQVSIPTFDSSCVEINHRTS
jgi:hypothetical protein